MLVRGSKGSYEMIDFRETMPAAGNETMYSSHGSNQTLSTVGGLAVGVPGELRGWEALHKRHGKLPWAELFEPAIKLNREGFKIPHELANAIKEYETGFICQDPYWADIYCANGTGKKEGELVKRLRYAKTLETLSKEGPDAVSDTLSCSVMRSMSANISARMRSSTMAKSRSIPPPLPTRGVAF